MKKTISRKYTINSDGLTCAGAGTSRWAFGRCIKSGKDVFIKEFLSPVYPSENLDLPEGIRLNRIKQCTSFYSNKCKIYSKIREVNSGNHVVPFDFFRDENKYFAVSEKIAGITMRKDLILRIPLKMRRVFIQSIAFSMVQLEKAGIVHSDLKPDNIILKKTVGDYYSVKLIDYDAAYFASDPPSRGQLQGDLVYLSPEMLLYMNEEDVQLTAKSDVFSFGILMHELLCGQIPSFAKDYTYLHEVSLNGGEVEINKEIPSEYWPIIISCLALEAVDRPGFSELFEQISNIHNRLVNKTHAIKPVEDKETPIITMSTPNVIIYMGARKKPH